MSGESDPAASELTHQIIGAAMAVHSAIGPGFLEAIYEEALCVELKLRSIPFARQVSLPMKYRGFDIGMARLDLLVDRRVIVELKAIELLTKAQVAQVIAYLKATRLKVGLLINFNATHLRNGIRRVINTP